MLLNGINHVAILTNDTDRLHAFYREVFDARFRATRPRPTVHGCRSWTSGPTRS